MKERHLLMSMGKWSYVTLACINENEKDLEDALANLWCGYCRADNRRKYLKDNYSKCSACRLEHRGVCGFEDAPYYKIEDETTTWETKRRAARKVFKAILIDLPVSMMPDEWQVE